MKLFFALCCALTLCYMTFEMYFIRFMHSRYSIFNFLIIIVVQRVLFSILFYVYSMSIVMGCGWSVSFLDCKAL